MKTLLINGISNITKEGVVLHFNQKFALNQHAVDGRGGLEIDEWYVSWDAIGRALCGDAYCDKNEIVELNKLRKVNPVDEQIIPQNELVTNIVMILEVGKCSYGRGGFFKERLSVAIKRVKELQPKDIIKNVLDDFNDAVIDILPEDFDGKKVNAIYDKILNSL